MLRFVIWFLIGFILVFTGMHLGSSQAGAPLRTLQCIKCVDV